MRKLWILLLLAGLVSCSTRDPQETGKEGKPLPEFSLLSKDSTTFSTKIIPAGKPTVLFYFGTHCPYSHAQMEEIIGHIDELQDLNIYMITTAPYNEMMEFYKQYSLQDYPNIIMTRDVNNFFGDYYKAPGVPFLAIYRKNKIMHEAYVGKLDADEIKSSAD
jgi:cytochrome oxidase Cu insertion factor (SCO1/SenC/PrrC family)